MALYFNQHIFPLFFQLAYLLQVYEHSFTNLILISILEPDGSKSKEKRQKGGKPSFLAPLQLSDALVKFLGTGESELSRADVIKRMWDYIKQNNLQVWVPYS